MESLPISPFIMVKLWRVLCNKIWEAEEICKHEGSVVHHQACFSPVFVDCCFNQFLHFDLVADSSELCQKSCSPTPSSHTWENRSGRLSDLLKVTQLVRDKAARKPLNSRTQSTFSTVLCWLLKWHKALTSWVVNFCSLVRILCETSKNLYWHNLFLPFQLASLSFLYKTYTLQDILIMKPIIPMVKNILYIY